MRLFVAVTPPASVLDALADRVASVSADCAEPVGWSLRAQWHISLAFLGEVGEQAIPDLERRLARAAARHAPMELCVRGAGGFGSVRRARVLWAGVGGDLTALRTLAGSVTAAARRTGIAVEERRFRAHLTLGRLAEPTDLSALVARLEGPYGPAWTVDRMELVRSHLGQGAGRRSRYETLHTWQLGRRAPATG